MKTNYSPQIGTAARHEGGLSQRANAADFGLGQRTRFQALPPENRIHHSIPADGSFHLFRISDSLLKIDAQFRLEAFRFQTFVVVVADVVIFAHPGLVPDFVYEPREMRCEAPRLVVDIAFYCFTRCGAPSLPRQYVL